MLWCTSTLPPRRRGGKSVASVQAKPGGHEKIAQAPRGAAEQRRCPKLESFRGIPLRIVIPVRQEFRLVRRNVRQPGVLHQQGKRDSFSTFHRYLTRLAGRKVKKQPRAVGEHGRAVSAAVVGDLDRAGDSRRRQRTAEPEKSCTHGRGGRGRHCCPLRPGPAFQSRAPRQRWRRVRSRAGHKVCDDPRPAR